MADNGFSPWWLRSPRGPQRGGASAPPMWTILRWASASADTRPRETAGRCAPALWVKTQAGAGNGAGADASAGDTAASAGGTAVSNLPGTAVRAEDCVLRLIDCHPIQGRRGDLHLSGLCIAGAGGHRLPPGGRHLRDGGGVACDQPPAGRMAGGHLRGIARRGHAGQSVPQRHGLWIPGGEDRAVKRLGRGP